MVKWRRSFPDKSHDFTAMDAGLTVGRIYRHFDGRDGSGSFSIFPRDIGIWQQPTRGHRRAVARL